MNNVRIDGTPIGVSANGLVRADLRNVTLSHNVTGIKTQNADNIINVDNMMVSFSTTGAQSSAGNTDPHRQQHDHPERDRALPERRLDRVDVGQQPDRQHHGRQLHQHAAEAVANADPDCTKAPARCETGGRLFTWGCRRDRRRQVRVPKANYSG